MENKAFTWHFLSFYLPFCRIRLLFQQQKSKYTFPPSFRLNTKLIKSSTHNEEIRSTNEAEARGETQPDPEQNGTTKD